MPQVPEFLRTYPDLDLDLQISDRFVNLIDDGVELALRIGHLSDSALRARRVGLFTRICVAETGYLNARGTPETPPDLKHHDCIVYSLLSTGATWRFADVEVAVSGRLRVSAPEAAREAALAGLGVALGPHWLFEDGLKTGRLKRILTGYEAAPVPIHILYVANRLLPRRATVFMDFMAAAFSKLETLNLRLPPSVGSDEARLSPD
jgi:DNA-binding transcriptional LysR family regulator